MKVMTVVLVALVLLISGCTARQVYRNHLCDSAGGAVIYTTVETWRAEYGPEIAAISPVEQSKAYSVVGPSESSTRLNSRFVEEARFRNVGLGIMEHDFRLIDNNTHAMLARWTRYYTGGWGQTFGPQGIPMAASCFAGSKEFLKLRAALQQLVPT
jgi:hypothetical protein